MRDARNKDDQADSRIDHLVRDENFDFDVQKPKRGGNSNQNPDELVPVSASMQIALVTSAMIGSGISTFMGLLIIVPGAILFLALGIVYLLVKPSSRPIMPAATLQLGQSLWMLLGILLVGGDNNILLEAILFILFSLWLAVQPRIVPAIILFIYQAVALYINIMIFAQIPPKDMLHKAMVLHIFLRIASMGFMVIGFVEIYTTKREEHSPPWMRSEETDLPLKPGKHRFILVDEDDNDLELELEINR